MRYSQEFKDNVVARLLSKELSISEAVEQYPELPGVPSTQISSELDAQITL